MASSLKQGRYRHYKGRDYIVSGVATHSESEEELVVYRKDYGDGSPVSYTHLRAHET